MRTLSLVPVVCAAVLLAAACTSDPVTQPEAPPDSLESSADSSSRVLTADDVRKMGLEYQLAVLDAGGAIDSEDSSIARFRSLLRQLDATFVENKSQISDMTVVAQQQLRKKGVEETLLNIMEGMNRVFVRKITNQKYAEYAAAYVVFRDKGMSHDEAVESLRGILKGFGAQ